MKRTWLVIALSFMFAAPVAAQSSPTANPSITLIATPGIEAKARSQRDKCLDSLPGALWAPAFPGHCLFSLTTNQARPETFADVFLRLQYQSAIQRWSVAAPPSAEATDYYTARAHQRFRGTVKWFNDDKGFGFITPEDGSKDCFIHHSSIQGTGFKSLGDGDTVEFNIIPGPKGPHAINLVIISRARPGT